MVKSGSGGFVNGRVVAVGVLGMLAMAGSAAGQARPWAVKVPPEARKQANPVPLTAENVAAGARVYENTCLPCHGTRALGDGPAAEFINPKPKPLILGSRLSVPDGVLFWVIANGIDNTGMASFKDSLSETERWQTIAFLHSLKAPPVAAPKVTATPASTPAVAGSAGTMTNTSSSAAP